MVATYFREGRGHSINALRAHEVGIFPATHAAKALGISIKLLRDIATPCERHHVGKYAALTDYYDTDPTAFDFEACLDAARALRAPRQQQKRRRWLRLAARARLAERCDSPAYLPRAYRVQRREGDLITAVGGNSSIACLTDVLARWRTMPGYLGRDGAALLRAAIDIEAERRDRWAAEAAVDATLDAARRQAAARRDADAAAFCAYWHRRDAYAEDVARAATNDGLLRAAGFDPVPTGKARQRALTRLRKLSAAAEPEDQWVSEIITRSAP